MSRRNRDRRKHTKEEERHDPGKEVGNMMVLERDPSTGYRLLCSCGHAFPYQPGGENSILLSKSVDGMAVPKAMCPECRSLWFEDKEFLPRQPRRNFVYGYANVDKPDDVEIVGALQAFSREDAALRAIYRLRTDHVSWTTVIIKMVSDEEYKKVHDHIRDYNSTAGASLFGAFLSDFLKGRDSGQSGEK